MKKKTIKKKIKPMQTEAIKSPDVPVTQRMLLETEAKLIHRMDARFDQVDARFNKVDARFNEQDAKFKGIDARLNSIEEKIHQVLLLVEEQNSRNIYALDKMNFHSDRVDRLEEAVAELQEKKL